jgi:hypothetical protein
MALNIYSFYKVIGAHFRKRRRLWFFQTFRLTEATRILDVGGYPHNWYDLPVPARVTLLNIDAAPPAEEMRPNLTFVGGDGRDLPFPDQSFDIVYSNSVIEHLADFEDQQRFAKESRRVGNGVYVQTPNRSFPIEPHFIGPRLPGFPREWERSFFRYCSVRGLLRHRDHISFDELFDQIRLLSYREMKQLFPDCQIMKERFCGLTKSFTAVRQPR